MNIKIDTSRKTIELEENVCVAELYEFIKFIDEPEKWTIKANVRTQTFVGRRTIDYPQTPLIGNGYIQQYDNYTYGGNLTLTSTESDTITIFNGETSNSIQMKDFKALINDERRTDS